MFSPLLIPPITHSCPFSVFLSLSLTQWYQKQKIKIKKTEKSVTMKQKAHKQKTEFTLFWQSTPEYGTWNVSNIPNVYKMRKIVFLLPSHIICRGFLS